MSDIEFIEWNHFTEKYPITGAKILGEGAYGKVYSVKDSVIKVGTLESLLPELNVLCQLNHTNIIKAIAIAYNVKDDILGIVMPKGIPITDEFIYDKINSLDYTTYREFVLHIIYSILCAVNTLHNAGFIHGDIKPMNLVLIDNIPTLIDFGMSRQIVRWNNEDVYQGIGYTDGYRSPSVLIHPQAWNNASSDIYAVGKTLERLIYGKGIYSNIPLETKDKEMNSLIKNLMSMSYTDIGTLLNHPIFSNISTCITDERIIPTIPEKDIEDVDWYRLVDAFLQKGLREVIDAREAFLILHNMHRTIPLSSSLNTWLDAHLYIGISLLSNRTVKKPTPVIRMMIKKIIYYLKGIVNTPTLWDIAISGDYLFSFLIRTMSYRYKGISNAKNIEQVISNNPSGKITSLDQVVKGIYTLTDIEESRVKRLKQAIVFNSGFIESKEIIGRNPITSPTFKINMIMTLYSKRKNIKVEDVGTLYHNISILEENKDIANEMLQRIIDMSVREGKEAFDIIYGRKIYLKRNVRSLDINTYIISYDELKDILSDSIV